MSERATRTNWQRPITGHKSNSGGRKGRKQAEKPTLTEQGIDVDEFIRENHARIQRLRETTPRSGIPVGAAIACDPRKPLEHDQKRDEVFDTFKHLSQSQKGNVSASDVARTLRMPKSTVLYQMNNLLMLGMLDRYGHTWTLKTRKDAR